MGHGYIKGNYSGHTEQKISVRFSKPVNRKKVQLNIDGRVTEYKLKDGWMNFVLPATKSGNPCNFELREV